MCDESKFDWNDVVKCKFRGKEVLGIVEVKKGPYVHWHESPLRKERKYLVKIRETNRHQLKWESELTHVKSFRDINKAYAYLGMTWR